MSEGKPGTGVICRETKAPGSTRRCGRVQRARGEREAGGAWSLTAGLVHMACSLGCWPVASRGPFKISEERNKDLFS